jgi:hypothetical protein
MPNCRKSFAALSLRPKAGGHSVWGSSESIDGFTDLFSLLEKMEALQASPDRGVCRAVVPFPAANHNFKEANQRRRGADRAAKRRPGRAQKLL